MSYTQRPCVCGGTTFLVLPGVPLQFGGNVGYTWNITGVVCQQCTRTEMFTNNADAVARHVAAKVITAGPQ